jgi:hypothetical protein
MSISFLLGTLFGALLMFLARVADKKQEAFLDKYEKRGNKLTPNKPIIIEPQKTPEGYLKDLQDMDKERFA